MRTPSKTTLEAKGLRFKPTAPATKQESLNPALERYQVPPPPTPFQRLLPLFRAVAVAAATIAIGSGILWFAPLGDDRANAELDAALRALQVARANPETLDSVASLREVARRSRATAAPEVAAALFAAAALGELHNGAMRTGISQCGYVRSTYPGLPAAALVNVDALQSTCSGCNGDGKTGDTSPGSLAATCPRCLGAGKELSKTAVRNQYVKALDEATRAVQSVGASGPLGFLRRAQSALYRVVPKRPISLPLPAASDVNATNTPAN